MDNNIVVEKEYSLREEIPVYRDQMQQVFLNIIDNAICALNEDSENQHKILKIKTKIELSTDVKYAVIAISNTGPKIPAENLKQIFDPFFTTKSPGEGTGLGLSIAYTLIKNHRGTIAAENLENGAVFLIKLPIGSYSAE